MDLQALAKGFRFTGDVARDAPAFLISHHAHATASHVEAVAMQAREVALKFGINADHAEIAGWLHDMSTIIPNEKRIEAARAWGVEVLPEEIQLPMIIHQKLSVVMARELFHMKDESILSAIGCHTTLKTGASDLDKVVFVAHKLAWDQPGVAPFHADMWEALERSLDELTLVYLQYLWDQRETLAVIHPWMREAYLDLSQQP